jgi:hypothetical protein
VPGLGLLQRRSPLKGAWPKQSGARVLPLEENMQCTKAAWCMSVACTKEVYPNDRQFVFLRKFSWDQVCPLVAALPLCKGFLALMMRMGHLNAIVVMIGASWKSNIEFPDAAEP